MLNTFLLGPSDLFGAWFLKFGISASVMGQIRSIFF